MWCRVIQEVAGASNEEIIYVAGEERDICGA